MDSAENKWRPHRAMGAGVWCAVAWCALAGLAALPGLAGLQPARPWGALGAAAAFRLETTLQLNDAARASKEIGYKLRARLLLRPRWARDTSEYLLEFQLLSPKLYLRGKHVNADFMPYDSEWDSVGDTTFYAHWSHGLIKEVYLNPEESTDVANYQKAVLSLFQFQMLSGEHNETDVSGSCDVLYETISADVFRKIKRRCVGDEEAGVVSARRLARYSLSGQRLQALHAEELLAVGHAQLGLKLRSWHSLQADDGGLAAAVPAAPDLAAALAQLPAGLRPEPLSLRPPHDDADEDEVEDLGALVQRWAGALADDAAGAGGGAEGARAALQLLPALRRAPRAALQALLRAHGELPGLLRLLGLAGTRAAVAAAAAELQLGARDAPLEPARVFLAAFAGADDPEVVVWRTVSIARLAQDGAVLDVLRLADEARPQELAAAALLAAAAAARRPAAPAVRDAALRGLARCQDAACRAPRLLALANLRAAPPDVLLQHAERADAAAPAALAALRAADAALAGPQLERLERLALRRDVELDVRAAALELLLRRMPARPLAAHVLRELYAERGAAGHELRRVLWGLVAELPALRGLPKLLHPELRGWDAAAPAGSSSVLAREPGWACGGWRAELQALQVAAAGLLRRGAVRLQALDPANRTHDVLSVSVSPRTRNVSHIVGRRSSQVEVWTRGLEAFGGGADADAGAAEEPAAGLALSVGGARLPDVQLFRGQAELLGHVWAATASTPTPVLRALRARWRAGRVALQAGLWARARLGAAGALALDAHATLSLWINVGNDNT
uniref:SFRICE_030091 n=1 Tax=Spodoptera frugiperda TaxID=7108 RepID=A0A2H1V2V3_SPOFR